MRSLCLLAALAAAGPAAASGKKHALLVGVTRYQHAALPNLDFPGNDVEELAKLLRAPAAGFAGVRVLSEARGQANAKDAPTAANIRQALKELLASRGKGDLVLIGLAGHGVQLHVTDPDGHGAARSYPFFCPRDADLLGVSYATGESKALLNLNALFAALGKCGAGTKLVLIDACRNTLEVQGARRSLNAKQVEVPEGVSALYSCGPGQVSWEAPSLGKGHGVFFYHVLEGLRGAARTADGEVTWDALKGHVRRQVPRTVKRLLADRAVPQVPHSVENIPGESPVLARADNRDDGAAAYRRAMALYVNGGPRDRAEAARLAKQAADKGHAAAQVMLGWVTFYGDGVPRDAEAGRALVKRGVGGLRQAAEAGDPDAQAWLGVLHQVGAGVDRDDKAAAAWLSKAADQGQVRAQAALGLMAQAGQGVAKDLAEAARRYRQAAGRGHAGAAFNLGLLYRAGQGVARDDKQAARWFRQAAGAGVPQAQHSLGAMYADGRGVTRDDREAVRWFKKAAEQNYAPALNDLGFMHEAGRGVTKDEAAAVGWFKKAAARGLARAAHNVGLAYELGRGVSKDRAEAVRWYRQAAAGGYEPARQAAARLAAGDGRVAAARPAR